jgi:hypothetical protein
MLRVFTIGSESALRCYKADTPAPRPGQPRNKLFRGSRGKDHSMIRPATHKRCPHCSKWLPFEAFSVNRRLKSGRSCWCKECARAAQARWRVKNAELINAARRLGERERDCVDCVETFAYRSTHAIRCLGCRNRRRRELKRKRAACAERPQTEKVRTPPR